MALRFSSTTAISALAALFLFIFFSFNKHPEYTSSGFIGTQAHKLNESIIALDEAATAFKAGKLNADALKHALMQARADFKKIEFHLAYHYAEYVKEHINGAPLLLVDRTGTQGRVLEPEGMQVLDELVFSEDAAAEKTKISVMTKKLRNSYTILYNGMATGGEKGWGVAALRLELVRILSLGITGFDTPGSLNALPEAEAALSGMDTFIAENYSSANTAEIRGLINSAVNELKGKDFESFDRLHFIKTYIDPVYAKLGKLDNAAPAALKHSSGWNSKSSSIFANDFLNPYFYTELKKEEDTEAVKSLGKALFYDRVLSSDGKISCASCHQPDKAFTDAVPRSLSSVQGKTVLRNAPTLINAVYADRYFYDVRAFNLEQQAEHVIFSHDEFNTAYTTIIQKLQDNKQYAAMFKKAFGGSKITRDQFSKALASYVLSLTSFNSSFDKYVRGEVSTISDDVKNGFNLFMGKAGCATCHFAPTFAGLVPPLYNENESEILGIPADPKAFPIKQDTDEGRLVNRVYNEQAWIYDKSFKTTTVRNAALTAPYFHNGAYTTLEEVIDFYNKGGGTGLGLNIVNQTLPSDPLGLTEDEKKDLIAFIRSLNSPVNER